MVSIADEYLIIVTHIKRDLFWVQNKNHFIKWIINILQSFKFYTEINPPFRLTRFNFLIGTGFKKSMTASKDINKILQGLKRILTEIWNEIKTVT